MQTKTNIILSEGNKPKWFLYITVSQNKRKQKPTLYCQRGNKLQWFLYHRLTEQMETKTNILLWEKKQTTVIPLLQAHRTHGNKNQHYTVREETNESDCFITVSHNKWKQKSTLYCQRGNKPQWLLYYSLTEQMETKTNIIPSEGKQTTVIALLQSHITNGNKNQHYTVRKKTNGNMSS